MTTYLPQLRSELVRAAMLRQTDCASRRPHRTTGLRRRSALLAAAVVLPVLAVSLTIGFAGTRDVMRRVAPLSANDRATLLGSARPADAAAREILRAFDPPEGATRTMRDPSGGRLKISADTLSASDSVDLTEFWRVSAAPHAVYETLLHSAPEQTALTATSQTVQDKTPVAWAATFRAAPNPRGTSTTQLVVEVAPATHGGTAIRVDAQSAAAPLRPPIGWIAPSMTRVVITRYEGLPSAQADRRVIVQDRQVAALTRIFNALVQQQPGTGACTLDTGQRFKVELFDSSHAPAAVADIDPACGTASVSSPHRPSVTLAITPSLIGLLRRLS